jgi:hypothetical protein
MPYLASYRAPRGLSEVLRQALQCYVLLESRLVKAEVAGGGI